jgi:hypothetical protein
MTTDAVGGVWNYALYLANALAEYGVSFDLATMGPLPSESQKQEAAALANERRALREYLSARMGQ